MKNLLILILVSLPIAIFGTEMVLNSINVGKAKKSQILGKFKISMDISILGDIKNFQKKQPIVIQIEESKKLTFVAKRFNVGKKEGDFSWVGKSKDGKAKASLSVRNGILVGTITNEDGKYKIYPDDEDYKVIKVDLNMVIPFYNDIVVEPERIMMPTPMLAEEEQQEDSAQENEDISDVPQELNDIVQASEPSASDSVVTLLVYYTQALKDMYGTNTEAMIMANLDLAKDAYIDSDTEVNLQVVMLKQVPSGSLLSTANPSDLGDLLGKLSEDGVVRYERQLYQADAITVFSKYPEYGTACGLGQLPQTTTSTLVGAYTAVHIKPAGDGVYCSDLTFSHELGHNFGCFHDSDHVSSGVPMYNYAYGYDILNNFGTIMSYDGPEISFFSNPRMTHTDGTPIGDIDYADNARAIKENQYKMADNSEQISEALESTDSEVDYAVVARLNTSTDRDGYVMWLEGSTTFDVENNTYGNNPFYLNIYNADTHALVDSFSEDKTIIFTKGRYKVVAAFSNDVTGRYYVIESLDYSINITTEYEPAAINPAIITYLLN